MNDKPTIKSEIQTDGTRDLKVAAVYPDDPRNVPTVYANFVGVVTTPNDVMLDFCQVQPQSVGTSADGRERFTPAILVQRVCLSKPAAASVAQILIQRLGEGSKKDQKPPVTQ